MNQQQKDNIIETLEQLVREKLFEPNNELTRTSFVNNAESYLNVVKEQEYVYDFRVKCDETNNTQDVIANNGFKVDVFLKPSKSADDVHLAFSVTGAEKSFE